METVMVNGRRGLTNVNGNLPWLLLRVKIQDVALASDWWYKWLNLSINLV